MPLEDEEQSEPGSAGTSPLLLPADADASPDSPLYRTMSTTSLESAPDFSLRDDGLSGLTLVDAIVSIDAHWELLSRRLKEKIPALRSRAERAAARKARTSDGLTARERGVREVARFRLKVGQRLKKLEDRWTDAKTVQTREKISFVTGVNNVLITGLAIGFKPHWLPMMYTLQAMYFLPARVFSYRRLSYHYFLFDFCYFMNALCLAFIWIAPDSPVLFEACYTLTHGPLATAIATWRNSLVFHSFDKVTSLFIHIYPPLVMMMIRHQIPGAEKTFPALKSLPELHFWRSMGISSIIYLIWQLIYYYFVIVLRREKIEKHGRVTSFTYLLNDKKGLIGKILHKIPARHREWSFMAAQYVYTLVTILPPILLLYNSRAWNQIYLFVAFDVASHNGATFYLEVFGRRFEKDLKKLQKELDDLQAEYSRAAETGRYPLSRTNSQYGSDGEGLLRRRSNAASEYEDSPEVKPTTEGLQAVSPAKLD